METSIAIIPRSLLECTDLAKQLAASSLLPAALKGKIPEVLMTIMAGQELGIPPIAALRSIHVIDGKTVLSSDIMQAVVLGNGSAKYVKRISASDVEATYETLRASATEPRRLTWTIEQAKKAGLYPTKDNWRCYPRAMLAARCKAELLRDVFPDSLAGCYTEEEADGFDAPMASIVSSPVASAPPRAVEDAEFVEREPEDRVRMEPPFGALRDALVADINSTATTDACNALLPRFALLPRDKAPEDRAVAHAAYKAQIAKLTQVETMTAIDVASTAQAAAS